MFDHLCATVRIIASDSAADELAAARQSASGPNAIFSGVEAVLRDKAHASRRCLSRPWHADQEINDILQFFIHHKNSMVQKIDHSPDLRRIFTRYVGEMKTGILRKSGSLVSLHSAKHRFESFAGPLGNWVVWLLALVFTAREVVIKRTNVEVKCAELFLSQITEERCILMAMLADAADDGLEFTRAQDGPEEWIYNNTMKCFFL